MTTPPFTPLLLPHRRENGNAQALVLFLMVGLVTFLVALVIGTTIGQGDLLIPVAAIVGITAIAVVLAFRTNTWLLMLLLWGFTGTIPVLLAPFSVREIGILIAFGMLLIFYAMKAAPRIAKMNKLDWFMWINVAYLATVYARNPAGLLIFETDLIGGRPYFTVAAGILAYFVLQHVTLTEKMAFRLPFLFSLSSFANSAIGAVAWWLPGQASRFGILYSGFGLDDRAAMNPFAESAPDRHDYATELGSTLNRLLTAYYNPIRLFLFLTPFLSLLLFLSFTAILFSGFRSALVVAILTTLFATYFQAGFRQIVPLIAVMFLGYLGIMGAVATGVDVPRPVQRALSFLPGEWDPTAKADAVGSAEWRFVMWKDVLTSDRYIKNKLLGDGFGYSQNELFAYISMVNYTGGTGAELTQEYYMIIGSYHSGPVSAVRFVGYIGLGIYAIFQIYLAIYGWKTIRKTQGSRFFAISLFFGIQTIIHPFVFWLIFGAFDNDLIASIFSLAMLNLINRSYDSWKNSLRPTNQIEKTGFSSVFEIPKLPTTTPS